MHVGAFISIPTRDARDLPQMAPQPQRMQQQAVVDPFEVRLHPAAILGLPACLNGTWRQPAAGTPGIGTDNLGQPSCWEFACKA